MSGKSLKCGGRYYRVEEKIEAVRMRVFQELSYQEVIDLYGISHGTLDLWMKKYKAEVFRRSSGKDLPLYVRKYAKEMASDNEELQRLRKENEDLRLINEACELMYRMAKERFNIDVKKTTRRRYPGNFLAWAGPTRKPAYRAPVSFFGYSKQAYYRAFLQADGRSLKGLVHHSDRGCQYCSSQYTATLGMKDIRASTTQDGSPYDNAIAERVNGILKAEWLEKERLEDIGEATY